MNKFIRLLGFEMDRFLKFLLPTLVISAVIQLFVTFQSIFSYNNQLEKAAALGEDITKMSNFDLTYITQSGLYELAIMLIILVFIFYSFFTWYREWYGKNTFIYRLLMLPMNRSSIILSKSLVFILGGFLAFVFQFGMYFIQLQLSQWLIESTHYNALNIHNVYPMYGLFQNVLFPKSMFEFFSRYSFAFAALISLFTGIIIERSFGLTGLIFGAIYFVSYFVVYGLLGAMVYSSTFPIAIRPSQAAILIVVYQILVILIGYFIGSRLLKNKIKV